MEGAIDRTTEIDPEPSHPSLKSGHQRVVAAAATFISAAGTTPELLVAASVGVFTERDALFRVTAEGMRSENHFGRCWGDRLNSAARQLRRCRSSVTCFTEAIWGHSLSCRLTARIPFDANINKRLSKNLSNDSRSRASPGRTPSGSSSCDPGGEPAEAEIGSELTGATATKVVPSGSDRTGSSRGTDSGGVVRPSRAQWADAEVCYLALGTIGAVALRNSIGRI